MKKQFFKFGLLTGFLVLFSCQDIIECVINSHPELPNKRFVRGRFNQFYSDSFQSDIKNSVHDDGYFYNYSIHGDLPNGLDYFIEHRTLIIEGIPEERGRFHFRIYLHAEKNYDYFYGCESELNDCDGLCKDSTSKDYMIEIQ